MASIAEPFHKTARLSVLLSPGDKQQIEMRARGCNLSVGEFIRRAADSYDPALDEAALTAMIDEWQAQLAAMRARIGAALTHVEERFAAIDALRAEQDPAA